MSLLQAADYGLELILGGFEEVAVLADESGPMKTGRPHLLMR